MTSPPLMRFATLVDAPSEARCHACNDPLEGRVWEVVHKRLGEAPVDCWHTCQPCFNFRDGTDWK